MFSIPLPRFLDGKSTMQKSSQLRPWKLHMPMSYMLTSVATIFANSSKMTTLIRVMDITTIVSHVGQQFQHQ